jgi:hypothetical protein
MKRENSRHRAMPFPARFLRPIAEHQPNLAEASSVSGQLGLRPRRIFIIEQTRRSPSRNAAAKKIRHILIFDNHPDSLRLAFGGDANPHGDLSVLQRVSSWELVLVSILTMGALIGMFWPLI